MTTEEAARAATELEADQPEAYIARDRRRALSVGRELPDRVRGAALFADISGFTPLTEALRNELGPQRGAEELTANIGRVFDAVIGELDAFGGDVIYFSGDAITCWIDGDDGTKACAAALSMQRVIGEVGRIVTPAGTEVQLAMKVAIAVGKARRFVVGDPDIQLIDVLAGSLIDDLAAAEHHATKGEVVLEPSAIRALGACVTLGELRTDEETRLTYAVLDELLVEVARTPVVEPPPLPEQLVRPWLLPAVYERLMAGRGEFLTELRPAIPVFLRFGGIDYDDDDEAIAKLDDFVRGAQRVMAGYGGNVLQLTLGDKGAYLYGVFGSPIAHEDDAVRAAAAALELRDLEQRTAAREIQIGVTRGTLRSGTYGHRMRRTFVCLGDEVNLSARLMSAAPPGKIYVSERIQQAAGEAFIWERLPDMQVKGKSKPVAVFSLNGSLERASKRRTRFELPLVGRRAELRTLDDALAAALSGDGRVIGLSAEAGMGKSRLVAEFIRSTRRRGQFVAYGECEAFGTRSGYFVWREIWRRLLGLDDAAAESAQIAALEARLRDIDPNLVPRVPLLGPVVGLTIPDSPLTRTFDAKLRKASLEDLLQACLRARAREAPFVVVLEDCHWIDELSRDLLDVLVRASAGVPVLFVAAYRPAAEPGGDLGLARSPRFSEIGLDAMDPVVLAEITRAKIAQLVGDGRAISPALIELVSARAEGNPFYVEELLTYVVAQGVDLADPEALAAVRIPDSLQALVLSRIDAAAEDPRRTMKVASVIGRTFRAPMLPGAYDELGSLEVVLEHLNALRGLDLMALDRAAEQAWMFKHAVTRDVAYDSLPFSLRSLLHGRVGEFIERTEATDLERYIPLLEHHYWRSDREDKKLEYLRKAAEQAQATYANEAAVVYYERYIPLLEGAERIDALLRLSKVLQLTGQVPRSEELLLEARGLAQELGELRSVGRSDHGLAEAARRLGRFDDATARLTDALAEFTAVGDEAGIGDVHHLAGTIANQRGDAGAARQNYLQSLAIRETLDDRAATAATVTNLGIVAVDSGEFDRGLEYLERAAGLYRDLGDRRGACIAATNLAWASMTARRPGPARRYSEEAITLATEIGDRFNITVSQHNLGNALRGLGEPNDAGAQFAAAMAAYRELDDRWGIAFLLEDVAALAADLGEDREAFRLLGAAESLRNEIGAARAATLVEELKATLAAARSRLGPEAADDAERQGSTLDLEHAIALALRVCRPE
ncbi:MAG TPA: AAA family ATPase [Candidatus Limnocylindrales bacterium]|nr:AAA family ATPase [Candidatus Limnocylindrales bacterium]